MPEVYRGNAPRKTAAGLPGELQAAIADMKRKEKENMTSREALEAILDSEEAKRYIWAYLTIALDHAEFDLEECDRAVDGMSYALDSYTACEAFQYTEEH